MKEVMESEDVRGTVSQMGSFRVARARIAISASRGYQSSPIAEKAPMRDSQLLIGPGIVHASLAHRGCPL